MGLAAAKNKRKLAKDPNNTRWSRNSDSFGHRMLLSQGWAPGQYLGPENAAHAEFHTAASASHIRVALRADNLGLGAKKNQGDECTGLDVFKDLLGRLNGKDETVIEEQRKVRETMKMSNYIQRKFGVVRFVSGGLLVGDELQQPLERDTVSPAATKTPAGKTHTEFKPGQDSSAGVPIAKPKKSRKRKIEDCADEKIDDHKSERKRRKEERRREKQTRKEKGRAARSGSPSPEDQDKSRSKSSKGKSKGGVQEALCAGDASERAHSGDKEQSTGADDSLAASAIAGSSLNGVAGRHLARRRFIAQKRRAHLDTAALNQIFMIKT